MRMSFSPPQGLVSIVGSCSHGSGVFGSTSIARLKCRRYRSFMGIEVDWNREDPTHREQMLAESRRLATELRRLGATRVVLFGSRARGDQHHDSDLDILAVMPSPPGGAFPERLRAIYELLRPRVAADIVVYTPEEVSRMPEGSLVADALAGGVEL